MKQESAKHFSSKRKSGTTSIGTESPSPTAKKAKTAFTVGDDSEDSDTEIATTPAAKSLKKPATKAKMAKAMTPIDNEPGSPSGTTDDEDTTNEKIQGKNILKNDPFGLIRATYKAEARSAQIKAGSNQKVLSTTSRSKPAVPAKATFPSVFAMTNIDTAEIKGLASVSERKKSAFANEAAGTNQEPENKVSFPDSPFTTPLTRWQKDETNEATNALFEKMEGNVPEEPQSALYQGGKNDFGFASGHVLDNAETIKQQEGKVHSQIEGCADKDEDTKIGEAEHGSDTTKWDSEHENMQNGSEYTTPAKPPKEGGKDNFVQTVQSENNTLAPIGRHVHHPVDFNITPLQIPQLALFPDQFRTNATTMTISFNVRVAGGPTRIISVPSNVSLREFFGNVSLVMDALARMRLARAMDCQVQYPGSAPVTFAFRDENAEMSWRALMTSLVRVIRAGEYEDELVQMEFS